MYQQVWVKLTKLDFADPNVIVSVVSGDLIDNGSNKSRKRRSAENVRSWFAKSPTPPPPKKALITDDAVKAILIRPAVLNVTPSKEKDSTFSPAKGSGGGVEADSKVISNPFLPPTVKSCSYLFGGTDDFERVPDDEIVILDSEDDTEDDEGEEEEEDETDLIVQVVGNEEAKTAATPIESAIKHEIPSILWNDFKKAGGGGGKSPEQQTINKIRFPPANPGNKNMIECNWAECPDSFTTHGQLSDHLKVKTALDFHCLLLIAISKRPPLTSFRNGSLEAAVFTESFSGLILT